MSTPTTAPCSLRGPDGLAIIGRTLHDLRGIRYGEGEGGATPAVPAVPATPAVPAAAAVPPAAPVVPAEPVAPAVPATEKVEDLQPWAQKIITDLRGEAAKARVDVKAAADKASQDLADKVAVALGLKPDAATDPAQLTALAQKAQSDARQASIQLAVYKAAAAHQANPDALLDSNTFLAKVSTLDPTAADFSDQVSEAIKAAVTAKPTLKSTARAAGASTVTNAGGTGENGQITEEQLAQMTPEQIQEAFDKGLLKNLLTK